MAQKIQMIMYNLKGLTLKNTQKHEMVYSKPARNKCN